MKPPVRSPRVADAPLGLRREEAARLVGISTSTLVRMVARGEFPAPRKVGERKVAWSRAEVELWFDARPISDLLPPPRTAA